MNTTYFQVVAISPETAISSYPNGETECCALIEAGDSFALSFSFESLEKLTDIIAQLQQIKIDLVEKKKMQLTRETKLLSAYNTKQVLSTKFNNRVVDF